MSTLNLSAQHVREQRSALFVFLTTVVALLAGLWVMTAVTTASNPVTRDSVTAAAPDGWLVQEGTGDLVMVIRNPRALDELFRVSQLPAEDDLETLASVRNINRARQEAVFSVLEATQIVFDGRDGYKVSYAYAENDNGEPILVEGVDYYYLEEGNIVVVSYEAEAHTFSAGLPAFQRFLRSISVAKGG